jgi:hypothetical protein
MLAKASPLNPIDFIDCKSSKVDSFDVVCLSHRIGKSSYYTDNSKDNGRIIIRWSTYTVPFCLVLQKIKLKQKQNAQKGKESRKENENEQRKLHFKHYEVFLKALFGCRVNWIKDEKKSKASTKAPQTNNTSWVIYVYQRGSDFPFNFLFFQYLRSQTEHKHYDFTFFPHFPETQTEEKKN